MTRRPGPGESLQAFDKRVGLEALDALLNRRDIEAASRFGAPGYIQHASHLAPGRDGLLAVVHAVPRTIGHEAALS